MKVLMVHNFYRAATPGGEDNVFRQERDLLRNAGVDVVCFTRSNDDVDVRDRRQVVRTAANMGWSWESYEQLSDLIVRERPDVAHFHNTFPLISASGYVACRDRGVPVVQTLHNYRIVCAAATFHRAGRVCEQCSAGHPWPAVWHRCYRGSLAGSLAMARMLRSNWRRGIYEDFIDVFVALTQFAASKFAGEGLPRERIVVSPNFVDSTAPASGGGGGYAIFVARLSEEKGVRVLLRAWRELRDIPLKVVGDGPLFGEFRAAARAEGLPIEFLGMRPREEAIELIGAAELQVIASECFEGFPLVAVESYARGTPLVAASIGGLTELVIDGETGLRFDAGDAGALASNVRRLWSDAALRGRLRHGARVRFESEYTPQHALKRLLAIYERARAQAQA